MQKRSLQFLVWILIICLFVILPAQSGSAADSEHILLRRATFDPLQQTPKLNAHLQAVASNDLMLLQFDGPPPADVRAQLSATGVVVLSYIPEYAFLVRGTAQELTAARGLTGVRWIGPYHPAYKLAPELDTMLSSANPVTQTVLLSATPDADLNSLATAVAQQGGQVLEAAQESIKAQIDSTALQSLIQRSDVVWVEPYLVPHFDNAVARQIMRVTQARVSYPNLDGSGQIVAVTDSGLDTGTTASVSADFAGRIVRGFTRNEMSASCAGAANNNWSDKNGHGTHVTGTVLGSGALSGGENAGIAPGAKLVIQSTSSGGNSLDCISSNASDYLSKAYNAGARIQNASFGSDVAGSYDQQARNVDLFLWEHKDYFMAVSAGNAGTDYSNSGVISSGSIGSPATAKNVMAVGASENVRSCASNSPFPCTWASLMYMFNSPFNTDGVSDNSSGMAAFSSRGPTLDGRIKPDIVAPGTAILSAASHAAGASYSWPLNSNYAYEFGTSMASPMVAGSAALVRQWLAEQRSMNTPSAALIKAMLLNGAVNMSPGQYGTGAFREIPAAWPNSVEGWGRTDIVDTLALENGRELWLEDETSGLQTGETKQYVIATTAGQPLRLTLTWTDYPGSSAAGRALVNDLDLQLLTPAGTTLLGNASASLTSSCRESGVDRCNNVETIEIAAPQSGAYVVTVRAHNVPTGPQPFALAMTAATVIDSPPVEAPMLSGNIVTGSAIVNLSWNSIQGASRYDIEQVSAAGTLHYTSVTTSARIVVTPSSYSYRVRACNDVGCGPYSNSVTITSSVVPRQYRFPWVAR